MGLSAVGAFLYALVVLYALVNVCTAQQQQQLFPQSSKYIYYLDTMKDCDGKPRDVGQSTVQIFGINTEPQTKATTSCTLTLNSENLRTPHRFKLHFLAVEIKDQSTQFFVYDGQAGGRIMWSFHSGKNKPNSLSYDFTTGQMVTFKMSRGENDRSYDIRVVAQPVESDVSRCEDGTGYGCDEYNYNYRLLGTKEILYIVGGCFGLIVLIVIIVVICCYRKQHGVSRRWKEQKLGQVNTAASLHSLNGKVGSKQTESQNGQPWTSESSKKGFASIRRSPNLPRAKIARLHKQAESASSVCDSDASLPMKPPLPPPQSISNPRSLSGRSRNTRGRRNYRDHDDDRFSDRSYSTDRDFSEKNYSERNYRPPTYREAIRHNSESMSSADETSFVQANDDHPQTVFVERVITPRVNKKRSPTLPRVKAPPPPEEDETYDSIEPKRSAKGLMTDKKAESSDEMDESDTDNESVEEESEEEEDSDDERKREVAAVYAKPNKHKSKEKQAPAPQVPSSQNKGAFVPTQAHPQQFQGAPYPGFRPPGVHQPQPRYGYPLPPGQQMPPGQHHPSQMAGQQPLQPGQQPLQPQLPGQQPMYPQGQQQPFFPGGGMPTQGLAPQLAAQPPPHPYHQANFTVPIQSQGAPMPPPYQPGQFTNANQRPKHPQRDRSSRQPAKDKQQPVGGDVPMYSYLVNRGYQPREGRYSPVSTSTGASNLSGDRNLQSDEADFSPNLGSGVELMKRKN